MKVDKKTFKMMEMIQATSKMLIESSELAIKL